MNGMQQAPTPDRAHPGGVGVPRGSRHLAGRLNTPKIVVLVIAAASPLAAMVGALPLAFAYGAGAATPLMYVLAGLLLTLFAVGYSRMSQHVTNAGGLYTYIAKGLGRRVGVASAYVALLAYNAFTVMLIATFSYYSALILSEVGLPFGWQAYAAAAIVLVAVLGARSMDVSARLLAVLVVVELAILVVVDSFFASGSPGPALPLESISPADLTWGTLAVGLVFAVTSFLGFEAAALYAEETVNPRRTIPRATFASVAVISLCYGLTSWLTVGAVGADDARHAAQSDLGELFFDLTIQHAGQSVADILALLLLTSLFATTLACHNATNRVVFALAREGVLPRVLGRVHGRHHSPHVASRFQTLFNVVVIGGFAATGLDPFVNLSVSMTGLGTLGLVLLQGMTSLAVIAYFWNRPDRSPWSCIIAPLIAAVGLFASCVLIISHYSLLTGVEDSIANLLPLAFPVLALIGVGHATWLRRHRPQVWAAMGEDPATTHDDHAPTHEGALP